ncbi:MAG TPA: hypothetical protein VNX60_06780, partial [Candidatus Acidoferrum sp.]|nr:hypothetical protein [Candidatus Acidoferrum sp.]
LVVQAQKPGIRRAFLFAPASDRCRVPHPSHREGWNCEGVGLGEAGAGFSPHINHRREAPSALPQAALTSNRNTDQVWTEVQT